MTIVRVVTGSYWLGTPCHLNEIVQVRTVEGSVSGRALFDYWLISKRVTEVLDVAVKTEVRVCLTIIWGKLDGKLCVSRVTP